VLFVLDKPALLLGIIIALYVGVVVGSGATVLTAKLLGDPMGQRQGKLSLNPIRNLQIYSGVSMVLAGYGWAEPVPLNDWWRARRFHVSAAVLARPIAYALLCLASMGAVVALNTSVIGKRPGERLPEAAAFVGLHESFPAELLLQMAFVFAALCVISLIPLPPTDLGRVIFTLGGNTMGWQKARFQLEERNFGLVIVLALLLLPIVFTGFPSWVGQLAPQLVRGLGAIVGLSVQV
jgi:hypothetical protein